ncbi:hypothetical protein GCM10008949_29040 [Deinococcus humi]|nr:hypothetical protein GCM10008949_29040 [Deinococcus humi]
MQQVCGTPGHPLAPPLRAWCAESRPFLAFAEANVSKLRKKVREAVAEGQQADLRAELLVAAWLLRSGSGVLTYEPLKAGGGRGPDFALRLTNGSDVYAEVARLRGGDLPPVDRLARVLSEKAGQLPPGAPCVLAAVLPTAVPATELLPVVLRRLARAAQGEALPGVPPEKARAFERVRTRLSGVVLFGAGEPPDVTLWVHQGAAHPLSPAALRALR